MRTNPSIKTAPVAAASHAFSHGFHPQHAERLAAYWAEALGGPSTFTDRYGDETTVVRMHSGNGPHEEMDRRAIECFDQAMHDVGLSADAELQRVLHTYFAWATTTTMARTTTLPMMFLTASRCRIGPGTVFRTEQQARRERVGSSGVVACSRTPANRCASQAGATPTRGLGDLSAADRMCAELWRKAAD